MKRRSMLGRRSSRSLQPNTPTSQKNYTQPTNYSEKTPTNERRPNPFHTPSSASSFSCLSANDEGTWSVFKSYNSKIMKSPGADSGKNSTINALPLTSRFKVPAQKSLRKTKITKEASMKEDDRQDLRAVTPPWSYGTNNLSTQMSCNSQLNVPNQKSPQIPSVIVTSDFDTKMLTRAAKNKNEGKEQSKTLKNNRSALGVASVNIDHQSSSYETSYGETQLNERPDFTSTLGNVSLGVDSLDLFNKHSIQAKFDSLYDKSKSSAYKLQLHQVVEEQSEVDSSYSESKENIPPRDEQRTPETDSLSSPTYNKTPNDVLQFETTPGTKTEQLRHRIHELSKRIEVIDDEKRALEDELRLAYGEILELLENNSTASMPSKRRSIPSAKKKNRPSYVASKLYQKDMKPTFSSLLQAQNLDPQAKLPKQVYTPKSLFKSINMQYSSIFDS